MDRHGEEQALPNCFLQKSASFTFFCSHLVQFHIQKHTLDDIGLQRCQGRRLDCFWAQSQLLLCVSLPLELYTHTHTLMFYLLNNKVK